MRVGLVPIPSVQVNAATTHHEMSPLKLLVSPSHTSSLSPPANPCLHQLPTDDTAAAAASMAGRGGDATKAASDSPDPQAVSSFGSNKPTALCSYGYDLNMKQYAATEFCVTRQYGKYGSPGGAVCEGAPSIAQCPRPWE